MPRIDATPHRMMAAHEVDAMAAITGAHIDRLGVRWQCCVSIRLSGNARGRCLRRLSRFLGGGRRRRRSGYRNSMNRSRQLGKLLRNGLLPRRWHRFLGGLDRRGRWGRRARPERMMQCCNAGKCGGRQDRTKDCPRIVHCGSRRHDVRRLQTSATSFSANERAYTGVRFIHAWAAPCPLTCGHLEPRDGQF